MLLIFDEIQTGLGRTGKLLNCDHADVRPDILLLGNSLSGGMYPICATLANKDVVDLLGYKDFGSGYGGSPLGCEIGMAAMKCLLDEGMIENSR